MGVHRIAQQAFNLNKADTATIVRNILHRNPIYKKLCEYNDGTTFRMTVRPNFPLILGTDMTVTLREVGDSTMVEAHVESQPWIIGDAFGFYDKYIRDFFLALDEEFSSKQLPLSALDKVSFKRATNRGYAVAQGVGLVLLVLVYLLFFRHGIAGIFIIPFAAVVVLALFRTIVDFLRTE